MKYLILGILVLSGCATGMQAPESIGQKNGKALYQADCRRNIGNCYSEASSVCNGSFDVENASSDSRGMVRMGNMFANVVSHTIIYTCKEQVQAEVSK